MRLLWSSVFVAVALVPICGFAQEAAEETTKVEVGAEAPNFAAANDEEEVVELKDFLAENNVVLVFVRAHW